MREREREREREKERERERMIDIQRGTWMDRGGVEIKGDGHGSPPNYSL